MHIFLLPTKSKQSPTRRPSIYKINFYGQLPDEGTAWNSQTIRRCKHCSNFSAYCQQAIPRKGRKSDKFRASLLCPRVFRVAGPRQASTGKDNVLLTQSHGIRIQIWKRPAPTCRAVQMYHQILRTTLKHQRYLPHTMYGMCFISCGTQFVSVVVVHCPLLHRRQSRLSHRQE
jgi:hypothetical protein